MQMEILISVTETVLYRQGLGKWTLQYRVFGSSWIYVLLTSNIIHSKSTEIRVQLKELWELLDQRM